LARAADQFIVRRTIPAGKTVIAGYHWFGDWGRDTMIALPGLTLATGRPEVARTILKTFARFVDQGMLPNCFPDTGRVPAYNTVDATLWYFRALDAYVRYTGDWGLIRELYPVLTDIVAWHRRGTRYGIQVDEADGLLRAGVPGVQLTWMDAKAGDWVVTPRIGKPVEINGLWIEALHALADFAAHLGYEDDTVNYRRQTERAAVSFNDRFWYAKGGWLYDVVDGPAGDDPALRPNQVLALALPHCPVPPEQARLALNAVAHRLLTSYGLRSLDPAHPDYVEVYGGDRVTRDGAYHQGTVWAWLSGPFVTAWHRVTGDAATALGFLEPFAHHLTDAGVGSISEILDGDPPHVPAGCPAQAWSVAEVLRAWRDVRATHSPNNA
jgi:predicted glycogen debranching enzyme